MPFSDLDEQLQSLGYGSQWSSVSEQLAMRKKQKNHSDIERVKQHNRLHPDKHREAKNRWAKKRFQQVKHRIGKQKCNRCSSVMMANDLIGQNRLPGHCQKCRKELL